MNKKKKKRAIFVDRDGIINEKPPEHDYVKKWKDFKFLPNIGRAIEELGQKFLVIIITNQRGIARKIMKLKTLEDIHHKMKAELKKQNAKINRIYFCPHNIEDNCNCRKPKPGLILKAAKDFNINLSKSYVVGDDLTDIEAGKKAGCKTILITKNRDLFFKNKDEKPDYIVSKIINAVKIIKKSKNVSGK